MDTKSNDSTEVQRSGVWEFKLPPPETRRWYKSLSLRGKVKSLAQSYPFVMRIIREITYDKRGKVVMMLWLVARLQMSVLPSLEIVAAGRLFAVLDRVIAERRATHALYKAFLRAAITRVGLWAYLEACMWLSARTETFLTDRMVRIFSERILRAYLRLSLESMSDHDTMNALKRLYNVVGLASGGRGGVRFSYLVHGLTSSLNIVNTVTQGIVLLRILRQNPTERVFMLVGIASYFVKMYSGFSGGRDFAVTYSRIVNPNYLKMRSISRIATDVSKKQEVEALFLGPHFEREYSAASEALVGVDVHHPGLNEGNIASKSLRMLERSLHHLPLYVSALKAAAFPNRATFSLASAQLVTSQTTAFAFNVWDALQNSNIPQTWDMLFDLEQKEWPGALRDGDMPYDSSPHSKQEEQTASAGPIGPSIEFRHVSFTYPGKTSPALQDVSFTIDSGSLVIFVGTNGSGKSTMLKLLCRLYDPDAGTILVDGIDVRQYRIRDLRNALAICWQDHTQFPVSLFDNIAFGDVESSDPQNAVIEAAKQGGAHDFISALPSGYDTSLRRLEPGEHGENEASGKERARRAAFGTMGHAGPWRGGTDSVNFSGGQWQRLALSRTMMRVPKARLLAFDEPSAALDPKAEYELFERIDRMRQGRTTLYISHRFGTFNKKAQCIFLLESGRIVEQGRHDELVAQPDSTYAKLYNYQSSAFSS